MFLNTWDEVCSDKTIINRNIQVLNLYNSYMEHDKLTKSTLNVLAIVALAYNYNHLKLSLFYKTECFTSIQNKIV